MRFGPYQGEIARSRPRGGAKGFPPQTMLNVTFAVGGVQATASSTLPEEERWRCSPPSSPWISRGNPFCGRNHLRANPPWARDVLASRRLFVTALFYVSSAGAGSYTHSRPVVVTSG